MTPLTMTVPNAVLFVECEISYVDQALLTGPSFLNAEVQHKGELSLFSLEYLSRTG